MPSAPPASPVHVPRLACRAAGTRRHHGMNAALGWLLRSQAAAHSTRAHPTAHPEALAQRPRQPPRCTKGAAVRPAQGNRLENKKRDGSADLDANTRPRAEAPLASADPFDAVRSARMTRHSADSARCCAKRASAAPTTAPPASFGDGGSSTARCRSTGGSMPGTSRISTGSSSSPNDCTNASVASGTDAPTATVCQVLRAHLREQVVRNDAGIKA